MLCTIIHVQTLFPFIHRTRVIRKTNRLIG